MRALQITGLDGPDSLALVDRPEPEARHMMTPSEAGVVNLTAAGAAFPGVRQSRGPAPCQPDPRFVPGAEVAGVVRSAPENAPVREGDRVAAFTFRGAFADVAGAPAYMTFKLPEALDYAQGA